jgi:uncharacterized protein (DUF362 family)
MNATRHVLLPPHVRPVSPVAILTVQDYQADLEAILWEALREFNLDVKDKSVLLKPNLVERDVAGAINTHPAVVRAARECFLRMGAREVLIGDGPGHDRDTEAVIEAAGLSQHISNLRDIFVDLNLDDASCLSLRTHASSLKKLFFPNTVLRSDFVVSMPKMKTHHWSGVTLSMKNMFGIIPGGCYGWPKNILHWAGIDKSILDINATVRPNFAIVDGIVGMEGNGPIQGSPKHSKVLVLGDDPVAVDASCARIMGIVPERVGYLEKAGWLLGHLQSGRIKQLGESIESVRVPFDVLQEFSGILEASRSGNRIA